MLDQVNSVFALSASILIWKNIQQIKQDKQTKGINILPTLLFLIWSYWNVFYFSVNQHWFSVLTAAFFAIGQTYWFVLFIKYRQ